MRMGKVFDPKVCVTLLLLFRTFVSPNCIISSLGFFLVFLVDPRVRDCFASNHQGCRTPRSTALLALVSLQIWSEPPRCLWWKLLLSLSGGAACWNVPPRGFMKYHLRQV